MKTKPWIIVMLLWAVWGIPIAAHAHRVNIFAWVEGDTVYTQSKFSGGRKAMDAKVEVYDDQENRLLDGRTDKNGEFSFKIPKRSALKVVLIAGAGHKNHWEIPLEEIEAAADTAGSGENTANSQPAPAQPAADREKPKAGPAASAPLAQLDPAMVRQIETVVEKAVERKLTPVTRMLAESMDPDPSLKDILGGLGYILGLVGIAAYVQSRKGKRP